MCLPSGLRTVIADVACERLYAGGADGNTCCIDMCRHAIQETLQWAGNVVDVIQNNRTTGRFEAFLGGGNVLPRQNRQRRDYLPIKAPTCRSSRDTPRR